MESETPFQLPKINLSGLDPNHPTGNAWNEARTKVMHALASIGCFEAIDDCIVSDLTDAIFGRCLPELFSLPPEIKKLNDTNPMYVGNWFGTTKEAHESLLIGDSPILDHVQHFTKLMWPNDNTTFCNTIWKFSKDMKRLDCIVRIMILQSLGVENLNETHFDSTMYGLRLSKHWVPLGQKSFTEIDAHKDVNMMTIITQNHIEGLEVKTFNGEWMRIKPSPNSFIVLAGESFEAWSNGRLNPPMHRVTMKGDETRYSTVFGSLPKRGKLVKAPEELIDEEYPMLFKPYDFGEYIRFRISEKERSAHNDLKAYCGVSRVEVEA